MKNILGIAGALLLAVAGTAQENYSTNWTQHKDMYVHTAASRANVPGNVTKFPLLVRLTAANFNTGFTQAKTDGADIRFTKADNTTRLPHQIESWDATGKTANVWVLMDSVKGATNNQLFRMHWANASAADSSKGPAVFDSTNGFAAVWHLNDAANQTDATGRGNTGVASSPAPAVNATSLIGAGKTFDGASTWYQIGTDKTAMNLNTNMGPLTISGWVNPTSCGSRIAIFSKYSNSNDIAGRQYALHTANTTTTWRFTVGAPALNGNGDAEFVGDAPDACVEGSWSHIAGTYVSTGAPTTDSSVNLKIYVNGALVTTGTTSGITGTSLGDESLTFIGRISTNERYMNGAMDEIQVSTAARSADWIKLAYETQKAASTAVSDAVVSILPGSASSNGFSVSQKAGSLVFSLPANANGTAVLTIADMKGRTVWTRTVSTGAAATLQSWNGLSDAGKQAAAGLYAVKLSLRDANGAAISNLSQTVSLAR